jgi:hypothetical protein
MAEDFVCSICGRRHGGLVTDQAYKLPDDVWSISESERAEKARFDSDLCQFGERFFIRGLLLIPFSNRPDAFGWGVWVEAELSTFKRYLELYEVDGSSEPPHRGVLANDILGYPSSLDSEVDINFRAAAERPIVSVIGQNGSRLAEEQQRGMSDTRYHQILGLIASRNSTDQ